MTPTSYFFHHTNDPAKHPQKPLPTIVPLEDDFVFHNMFIDSIDILDLDLDDFYLPKSQFPTDT
jgi:hypothetical protein